MSRYTRSWARMTRWAHREPREAAPPTQPPATGADIDPDVDTAAPAQPGDAGDPGAVARLSNEELCHEWRRTFLLLLQQNDPPATLAVVRLRQLYLDEMERRNPFGLQAWFDSGPRAAGVPDTYLGAQVDRGRPDGI